MFSGPLPRASPDCPASVFEATYCVTTVGAQRGIDFLDGKIENTMEIQKMSLGSVEELIAPAQKLLLAADSFDDAAKNFQSIVDKMDLGPSRDISCAPVPELKLSRHCGILRVLGSVNLFVPWTVTCHSSHRRSLVNLLNIPGCYLAVSAAGCGHCVSK